MPRAKYLQNLVLNTLGELINLYGSFPIPLQLCQNTIECYANQPPAVCVGSVGLLQVQIEDTANLFLRRPLLFLEYGLVSKLASIRLPTDPPPDTTLPNQRMKYSCAIHFLSES